MVAPLLYYSYTTIVTRGNSPVTANDNCQIGWLASDGGLPHGRDGDRRIVPGPHLHGRIPGKCCNTGAVCSASVWVVDDEMKTNLVLSSVTNSSL